MKITNISNFSLRVNSPASAYSNHSSHIANNRSKPTTATTVIPCLRSYLIWHTYMSKCSTLGDENLARVYESAFGSFRTCPPSWKNGNLHCRDSENHPIISRTPTIGTLKIGTLIVPVKGISIRWMPLSQANQPQAASGVWEVKTESLTTFLGVKKHNRPLFAANIGRLWPKRTSETKRSKTIRTRASRSSISLKSTLVEKQKPLSRGFCSYLEFQLPLSKPLDEQEFPSDKGPIAAAETEFRRQIPNCADRIRLSWSRHGRTSKQATGGLDSGDVEIRGGQDVVVPVPWVPLN